MFLSYVQLAIIVGGLYFKQQEPYTRDLEGYLYWEDNDTLCLRVENVYVELNPSLIQDKAKKR